MQVLTTKQGLVSQIQACVRQGKTIGFVPTMGALHDGHATLVKRACAENDVCVVSVLYIQNVCYFHSKLDENTQSVFCRLDVMLLFQR